MSDCCNNDGCRSRSRSPLRDNGPEQNNGLEPRQGAVVPVVERLAAVVPGQANPEAAVQQPQQQCVGGRFGKLLNKYAKALDAIPGEALPQAIPAAKHTYSITFMDRAILNCWTRLPNNTVALDVRKAAETCVKELGNHHA